ncbi:MAG: class I SAM-dependent methyltransferase [Solirubrobacteraceae bacterium]
MSEEYTADNLLDRHTPRPRLEAQHAREIAREEALAARGLGLSGGDILSVGSGWHPGRHLFPSPAWRLTAVDPVEDRTRYALEQGLADEAFTGLAGEFGQLPDGSFDAVLYRYVLHHVVFDQPLAPVLAEAHRLLRPGGVAVVIEPNVLHPVGAALALANRLGLGVKVHGTPDDIPLAPRSLATEVRRAGLVPEVHAVTYSWRRLPVAAQRVVGALDRFGSSPGARWLGHTFMLIARRR